MKTLLFFLGLSALFLSPLQAQPDLAQAQQLYEKNEFRQAAAIYQAALDSGYVSADLYYNLGNAWFKLNDIPRAILHYERAARLAPNNDDIEFNLNLSRSLIFDRIEAVPDMFLMVWLKGIRDLFSVRMWSRFSVAFFMLSLAALLFFFFMQMGRLRYAAFWVGFVCLLLSLTSFTGAFFQYRNVTSTDAAIVFSPSVTAKSAPGEGGTNLFILHEGIRVEIEERVGDWIEVRIPDGTRGWLRKSDVAVI